MTSATEIVAVAAALALHQTAPAHVAEDALQELVRDVLVRRDGLGLQRPRVLGGGELEGGPHRVVGPG
jgi:hypothetical protein